MPDKRCARCGITFDVRFFRQRGDGAYAYAPSGTRSVCLGCEQTARDERKNPLEGRWKAKIRDTIRRHAVRLGVSAQKLEETFGWTVERMVHEGQHAYQNGCSYCGALFREMGHGLADLTLDIVNPTEAPYYTTNTRWACPTCNRQKSRTPAADWGAKRAAWDQWKRRPKVPIQPRLFED